MLGASRSNLAWPNTTCPSTVSLTTARLHRSPVDVAVPVHSPSYGPAASALLNCGKSSKKAAVVTMSGPFIAKPPCCMSFYDGLMPSLPLKRIPQTCTLDQPRGYEVRCNPASGREECVALFRAEHNRSGISARSGG